MSRIISWALIAMVPFDWWSVIIVQRLWMQARDVIELRRQRWRLSLTASAATLVAAIAGDYLLGSPIREFVFPLFVLALLAISGPNLYFLWSYWRRKTEEGGT